MTVKFYTYNDISIAPNKISHATLKATKDVSEIQLVKQDGMQFLLNEFIDCNYCYYEFGSRKYVATVEFLSVGNGMYQYTVSVDPLATAWENGLFNTYAFCVRSSNNSIIGQYDPEISTLTNAPTITTHEWNKKIYASNSLGYLYVVNVIDKATLRGGFTSYILTPEMYDDLLTGFANFSAEEQARYSSCMSVMLFPEDVINSTNYASTTTPITLYSKNQEWFAGWRDLPAYVSKQVSAVGGYVSKLNQHINDFNTDSPIEDPTSNSNQFDRYIFQMIDGTVIVVPVCEIKSVFNTIGIRTQVDLLSGLTKYVPIFGGVPYYKYATYGNSGINIPFLSSTSAMSDPIDLLRGIISTGSKFVNNPVGAITNYISEWRTPSISVSSESGGGKTLLETKNRIILEHYNSNAGSYQNKFGVPDGSVRVLNTLSGYVRTRNVSLNTGGLSQWIVEETQKALNSGVYILN